MQPFTNVRVLEQKAEIEKRAAEHGIQVAVTIHAHSPLLQEGVWLSRILGLRIYFMKCFKQLIREILSLKNLAL